MHDQAYAIATVWLLAVGSCAGCESAPGSHPTAGSAGSGTATGEDAAAEQDGQPHACSTLPTTKVGGRGQTVVRVDMPDVGDDTPDAACFWIDQTEVTVEQYVTWRDSAPEFDDWDPDRCPWKATGASDPVENPEDECRLSIDSSEADPFATQKPIRCVDWCDAEAFCRSAGEALCHDSNAGGAFEPEGSWPEWRLACTNSYATAFPWGDEPPPGQLCNVDQEALGCGAAGSNVCGPSLVGQFEDCRSDRGAADLIGNVAEWVFMCDRTDTPELPDTACRAIGGSYAGTMAAATCSGMASGAYPKNTRSPDLGFRCCSGLSPAEREQLE
jgi:sulfatase modifying factor 1